jgi:DNA polymerase-3 subunit delta
MILFLYGKDTYRLQQKLKEIEAEYKKIHKSGLNLEKIDALKTSFKEFWDNLFQRSMFIKKKLFFLENLFSNQKFKEQFTDRIKEISNSEDIVVVFEKKELNQSDKTFRVLKKYGKSQEFKLLTAQELRNWIEKEFEKRGRIIDSKALLKLVEFVGNNLWQMDGEIKKLTNYKKGTIREEDVNLLVKPKIEAEIFETIGALAQKNKKKALKLLHNHLDKGDSPLYLLKMITFQFRNLLIARYLREQGKTLDNFLSLNFTHPFVAKKSWQASQYFTLNQLKKIYQKIFMADLNIKTGKISPEEGLKWLVAQI